MELGVVTTVNIALELVAMLVRVNDLDAIVPHGVGSDVSQAERGLVCAGVRRANRLVSKKPLEHERRFSVDTGIEDGISSGHCCLTSWLSANVGQSINCQ
jgi:hypothetical protein